jgi:CheY-like chemotaxis protein
MSFATAVEALAFLHREGDYGRAPRPDLILLELNLPRKDGRAVLAEIKADEGLKSIPVVVLTTSGSEDDIAQSYSLGTNSYVRKPMDFEDFVASVKSIHSYWLETATLPRGCAR